MWRNYLTVAVRALAKNRTYSVINIAGLAIGMAACLMILLYIRYERSYDNWLPDVENTYQLQAWYPHPQDGEPAFLQMSAYRRQGRRLKKDFPQVERAVYVLAASRSSSRTARPRRPRIICSPTTISSRSSICRCCRRRALAAAADRSRSRRAEAMKRFGTDQSSAGP